jgi:hypothetical protein
MYDYLMKANKSEDKETGGEESVKHKFLHLSNANQ